MSNRRAFLQAAGGAAFALGTVAAFGQAPAPKRVTIGGRRVSIIDVHAHCVFPEVAQRVPGVNAPRVAPPTLVLGPERLAAMDERGIDIQALSVNAYWWYSANRADASKVVATHDEGIAAWCKQHPDALRRLELRRAAISGSRGRAARARRQESWAPRRVDRRSRRQRAADEREVRSVLGQSRRARRARVHASEQCAEHRARRRARRPRRLGQYRRQSARDDGVLEPHDLRRHARPFSAG